MVKPFKKKAVYEDLYSIPENTKGQIIDGDLWALPRAGGHHSLAIANLTVRLSTAFPRDPKGWVFLSDVELRVGKHLLVPDLCGWRRERMPEVPNINVFELAPDWVCEVFSPSTAFLDKGRKREIFAEAGVKDVWFVDPATQTIDVLERHGKRYEVATSVGSTGVAKLVPFESYELDLTKFWAR